MKLLITIVDKKHGGRATKIYHDRGCRVCIEQIAKGTATSEILELLELSEDKDVILGICLDDEASIILKALKEELELDEKGTGVAFTIPISSIGKSTFNMINNEEGTCRE